MMMFIKSQCTLALLVISMQGWSGVMAQNNHYAVVDAVAAGSSAARNTLRISNKYVIASFPDLRQVAYCHLPDNVWRPLVIGNVTRPMSVAIDSANARLFVGDPSESMIYWYALRARPDGLLETVGGRHVAVEGYTVNWMAVNSVGDLYFTGQEVVPAPGSTYGAVYRQDAVKIATLNSLNPAEVYARPNSGSPNPAVWMPSGIAVDSFNVFWGNQESGQTYGSVMRGARQNIGLRSSDISITRLSSALEEVRGLTCTGTTVFYVSPNGVFGVPKTTGVTITDPSVGLVSLGPSRGSATSSQLWDPKSIAWDGDGTLYFTDASAGEVLTTPALNSQTHIMTKFADAPGVHGVAVLQYHSSAPTTSISMLVLIALVVCWATAHPNY